MKLIVGLGNPGKEYIGTRHNFGFAVVESLAEKTNGTFTFDKKFSADICEIFINGEKVILAKPQTFMNKSGVAVQAIVSYYNITTDRIWVVYDDIDLELGAVRIRRGGSSGGHKGVQSIIDCIGTEEFPRFRMGIGSKECDYLSTEDIVLQKFPNAEIPLSKEAVEKAISEIEKALKEGIEHLSV